jgi:MFS family permease
MLYKIRTDSLLAVSITAKAFFWFIGSLQILTINELGVQQFGLTKAVTSMLIAVVLLGIAVGSLISPLLAKGIRWYGVLAPAVFMMAVSMFAVSVVPYVSDSVQKLILMLSLGILGAGGGLYSVPLASFVQVRPASEVRGRVIAASMLADFTGILISGAVFHVLSAMRISPSNSFAFQAAMVTAAGLWLIWVLPKGKNNA